MEDERQITYRCPSEWWGPDGRDSYGPLWVVGCGHRFDATPDEEGLVDCPECGIWFPAEGNELLCVECGFYAHNKVGIPFCGPCYYVRKC